MTHRDPRLHHVCGGCYIEKVSARLDTAPWKTVMPQTTRCCRCNRPVYAELRWEAEPVWMFVPYCPHPEARP